MKRRWMVVPPFTGGDDTLEGMSILAEVGGPLGMALWIGQRDVRLWALVPAGSREGLFGPEAAAEWWAIVEAAKVESEWWRPLKGIERLLRDPLGFEVQALASSCVRLSELAEARRWRATALAYIQQAALLDLERAWLALGVGRLADDVGDEARAEAWYRRTVALGRASRDWRSYAEAFVGLARLYGRRGDMEASRWFMERASQRAQRHGFSDVIGRWEG